MPPILSQGGALRFRTQVSGEEFKAELPKVVDDFFKLPPYTGRHDLYDLQTETQKIYSPVAEDHYLRVKESAWDTARNDHNYPDAIGQMRTALTALPEQGFDEHDSKAIRIFFLRRLGRIYEHWATFGEKDKQLDDPDRKAHFLLAAYNYMLGEIELGVMTEYSGRVSESLRGMGSFDLASAFDRAFWGPNIAYISDNVDTQILKQKGSQTSSEQSGGAIVEGWIMDLPDVNLN